ncbi:MAG: hypothetical protein WA071_24815 [Undibacterium umbellatum]|uniref:hypothetical protein n=1 Tax=Undibacterium umbellatum TaxID=2762300 RepID=UPI003BB61788
MHSRSQWAKHFHRCIKALLVQKRISIAQYMGKKLSSILCKGKSIKRIYTKQHIHNTFAFPIETQLITEASFCEKTGPPFWGVEYAARQKSFLFHS